MSKTRRRIRERWGDKGWKGAGRREWKEVTERDEMQEILLFLFLWNTSLQRFFLFSLLLMYIIIYLSLNSCSNILSTIMMKYFICLYIWTNLIEEISTIQILYTHTLVSVFITIFKCTSNKQILSSMSFTMFYFCSGYSWVNQSLL